ncbi:MAG: mechanosensitive ion channel family protein [Ardenticatenaceae bacterium]|nr:mechanosensitive ion channel family protein [Ardenticatenaceae bacterium]
MNPILQNILIAAGIMVAAWAVSWLVWQLLGLVRQRLTERTKTQLDDVFMKAVRLPLRLSILVWGMEIALAETQAVPEGWVGAVDRLFFVLYAIIVYLALYWLISGLINWYAQEVSHLTKTDWDDRFLTLFRRIGLVVLTAVVVITILGRYGIEISGLVTTLGIGSLAVALAAQETLGDMITGFTIMIDQPFKVGDRVEVNEIDTWGDVVDIGLRSTRIRTRDNRTVSVPNSVIGKGLIVNYSDPTTKYRVQTHVGIAYGSDVERARQVMIEAIEAEDWVMKNERIEALFLEFGDSALIFRVRCWIEHYVETRRIIDKMNTALYQALNREGIEIPFPQRVVHVVRAGEGGNGADRVLDG